MYLFQNKIIPIVLCLMIFSKCNPALDFNFGTQVSASIKESKKANVFITQYKIERIEMFKKTFVFPIKEVWVEKSWSMNLDSTGKEFLEMHPSSPPNMVFLLNKNDSLNEENYLNKWFIMDADTSSTGIAGHYLYMTLGKPNAPDSLQLHIYELTNSNDFKHNLKPIADFLLKRE